MANSAIQPSGSWADGVASIIDSIANLYQVVATKSPVIADTFVMLAALLPFYLGLMWYLGLKKREKNADNVVKEARKASSKPGKGKPKGRKP
ncbi:hypothetical protein [Pseudomonas sp. QD4]|uniref:hypothetical protein n=1 Tax=Pseudomonas sp. QD4 TaxID=3368618 RepID=UPI003B9E3686